MIALLSGKLVHKSADHLIVDVGGVGYHVIVSLQTFAILPEPGEDIKLHIFTYVREDQLNLYGFLEPNEKELFKRLINVSGIGPKLAINILSGMPAHELVLAVKKEDIARLNAIPGVGRKTADRIIIDLKDKLIKDFPTVSAEALTPQGPASTYDDALSALLNLGYSRPQALEALAKACREEGLSLKDTIKNSLKELART